VSKVRPDSHPVLPMNVIVNGQPAALTIESVAYPPEMTTCRVLIRAERDGRELSVALTGAQARQLAADITTAADEYGYPDAP
jgi:hypothetical protein